MSLYSAFSLRTFKVKLFRCGQKSLQEAEGSFYSLIISELAPLAGIKKDFIGWAAKHL